MLTETQARNAKPKAISYVLTDGGGLRLLVRPSGNRTWQFRYRQAGKENLHTIGPYPAVSLAAARAARDTAKGLLRTGHDPNVAKRVERASVVRQDTLTFETVAQRWHEAKRGPWSKTHAEDVLSSLQRSVFPKIGNIPVRDVDADSGAKQPVIPIHSSH